MKHIPAVDSLRIVCALFDGAAALIVLFIISGICIH